MTERRDLLARLRLIRTPQVGSVTFRQLLLRFGTAEAALAALPDLARRGGGEPPASPAAGVVEREAAAVERLGGRYLVHDAADYPPLLSEIEGAPPVLTAIGDPGLLRRPAVAMVGARNASAAGARLARGFAAEIGAAGVTVVSGLARGIDTAAHLGSLDTGTVAVIAGGLDNIYPPENEALQRAICERGLLLAEQPPGTEPRGRHFPHRNRIIAGVSLATLVVEAALKSGSLITARRAGDYGRDVLAIPGSPLDPRAQGANQLIREGATLVQSAADVLEALRPLDARAVRATGSPFDAGPAPTDVPAAARSRVTDLLGPVPVSVDELIRQSGVAPTLVQTVLLELEIAGRLDRHAGGRVSCI